MGTNCVCISSKSRAVDVYIDAKSLHGFRKPLKKLKLKKVYHSYRKTHHIGRRSFFSHKLLKICMFSQKFPRHVPRIATVRGCLAWQILRLWKHNHLHFLPNKLFLTNSLCYFTQVSWTCNKFQSPCGNSP